MPAIQFINAVLGLFSATLSALIKIPVFAFFLGFLVLAAIYALCRYVLYVSKSGVR